MEDRASFKFFRLMLETWLELEDDKLRADYFVALAKYWLDGETPTDPIMKALLKWAMHSIDKSNKISDGRSKLWKKHQWNQYTKGDTKWKAQKKPVEQNGTNWNKLEQNGTEDNISSYEDIYSSYYGKSKWIDEKVCDKLISGRIKQWVPLDLIKKSMVLYNCECRIRQDYKFVKKLETWLKEFQPPSEEQLDEELYAVIKSFRDKKKSDDKFWQSSPAKTLWNDLKTTFWDDKVKSLWKQVNSINLTFT